MSRHEIQEHTCVCGSCGDYICPQGFCWCDDNRDPIAAIAGKFPSPVCDSSDGTFWREEVDILRVIFNALESDDESPLVQDRGYMKDTDTYGVSWYWNDHADLYPRQWDGPVIRLWSRLMIRPVRCAGGYAWVILSDKAMEAIRKLPARTGRHYYGETLCDAKGAADGQ